MKAPDYKSIFSEGSTGAEKVAAFLSKAGIFYVGTVDGDKPRIRPFSWFDYDEKEDKLIFSTGSFKDVYHQLQENPHIEIHAVAGPYFIRYDGIVRFLDDDKIRAQIGRDSSYTLKLYRENGWKYAPFTIDQGHCEVRYSLYEAEEFDV